MFTSTREITKLAALLLAVAQCSRGTFVASFQLRSSLTSDLRPKFGRKVTFARHELLFPMKNDRFKDVEVKPTSPMCEHDETECLTRQIVQNLPKAVVSSLVVLPCSALANTFSDQLYNPDNFKPVCAASDSFYRFLQGTTLALVGQENFVEYGPLISGGLLRIRLELCVVESYFSEAIIPFIKANGIGWILPIHETVETFLAGFIFAVATTFILVGSTKLLAVITFYGDILVGFPCRLFGGFALDRALGKPVTLEVGIGPWKKQLVGPATKGDKSMDGDEQTGTENSIQIVQYPVLLLSGAVKAVGEVSRVAREVVEGTDFFVGRYLTIIASGYIAVKFLHFKVFPDFPPF